MSSTRETVNSIITDAEKISHCLSKKPLEKKIPITEIINKD